MTHREAGHKPALVFLAYSDAVAASVLLGLVRRTFKGIPISRARLSIPVSERLRRIAMRCLENPSAANCLRASSSSGVQIRRGMAELPLLRPPRVLANACIGRGGEPPVHCADLAAADA